MLLNLLIQPTFAEDYFNILSIDGGGIRGLIPAITIKHMEEYAFQYVQEKGYEVPTYSNAPAGGMHLSQLFNMTAGTSTGSILAAGLSIYDENNHTQPALYSDDLIEIYSTKGDQIFMS